MINKYLCIGISIYSFSLFIISLIFNVLSYTSILPLNVYNKVSIIHVMVIISGPFYIYIIKNVKNLEKLLLSNKISIIVSVITAYNVISIFHYFITFGAYGVPSYDGINFMLTNHAVIIRHISHEEYIHRSLFNFRMFSNIWLLFTSLFFTTSIILMSENSTPKINSGVNK